MTSAVNDVRVAVLSAGPWGRSLVRNLYELGALRGVVDPHPAILSNVDGLSVGSAGCNQ
jgi:hypothetical protein